MATEKDMQVFQESLKGQKAARDRFGTPMVEGEIIAYATAQNSAAHLKVGKILKVTRTPYTSHKSVRKADGSGWDYIPVMDQKVVLSVRGAEKHGDGEWKLQQKASRFENIHNAIVLTDVKPEILELFKDINVPE